MSEIENDMWFSTHSEDSELAQFASRLDDTVDAAKLLDYLQERERQDSRFQGFSGRGEFCEIVGIGESTLSGWLKGDRIPKMAKLVLGLVIARASWAEERAEFSKKIAKLEQGERIVRTDEGYMIVDFGSDDGAGRIVARNVPDLETAKRLVSHQGLTKLLSDLGDLIERNRSSFKTSEIDDQFIEAILGEISNKTEKCQRS